MVSHTYYHGFLTDCDRTTGGIEGTWAETIPANGDFNVVHGDYFDLENTAGGGALYYVVNGTDIDMATTTTFPYILWRYCCSNANVLANIQLEWDDANTQTVVSNVNSTTWTVGGTTLTTGKTLDHVQLAANSAVGHVYYDFVLLYHELFTWPNVTHRDVDANPRPVYLPVPGRRGDITQQLGTELAVVRLDGDLTAGDWTKTYLPGDYFLVLANRAPAEPWQWLDLDDMQFKATLDTVNIEYTGGVGGRGRTLRTTWHEYRRSDAGNALETTTSRFGLDL